MNADDVVVKSPIDYATDPIFQQVQYYVRLAFEEGYRAAKPATVKNEWKPDWFNSTGRNFLLDNGLITGNEGYK
jgi:hypothetical protein